MVIDANVMKRLCPECGKEVTLTVDPETRDREGRCKDCGLDVGAIVNRSRYNKAAKKLEEEENAAAVPPKKKSSVTW